MTTTIKILIAIALIATGGAAYYFFVYSKKEKSSEKNSVPEIVLTKTQELLDKLARGTKQTDISKETHDALKDKGVAIIDMGTVQQTGPGKIEFVSKLYTLDLTKRISIADATKLLQEIKDTTNYQRFIFDKYDIVNNKKTTEDEIAMAIVNGPGVPNYVLAPQMTTIRQNGYKLYFNPATKRNTIVNALAV
ncbi:MAG: hypothetical protein RLZZ175_2768 [Bacteroidota bacterium]|jgi:phosphoribosylanthranilate isomerase